MNVDRPQIAFGSEDEGVAVQRGIGVIAAVQRRRVCGEGSMGCSEKEAGKGEERYAQSGPGKHLQ
jgi:hypothetical protein